MNFKNKKNRLTLRKFNVAALTMLETIKVKSGNLGGSLAGASYPDCSFPKSKPKTKCQSELDTTCAI